MKPLALLLALLCSTTFAAPLIKTPQQISAAIDKQGAHAFLASLDEQASDKLLDHIGSGQAAWVALAPKLATGADAAIAEGLGIALAYALPKNASVVLKAVDPVEGDTHILAISRVCGIPFVEEAPFAYKTKALRAVAAVKNPALRQVRERCLAALKKS